MNQPPTNICPLRALAPISATSSPAVCIEGRCAFWDFGGSECTIVTAAIAIREVAENLEVLAHKEAAPSAANTESGKETQQDA